MDDNTLENITAALQSARADFAQGMAKIDRALAALNGASATAPAEYTGADLNTDLGAALAEVLGGIEGAPDVYFDDEDRYDEDYDDEYEGEQEIPSVTFEEQADGTVVESEGAAELFEATAQALEDIRVIEDEAGEPVFGEFHGEDHLELTFSKVDLDGEPDGNLTVDEVKKVLMHRFTQTSLGQFGNLALAKVEKGDNEATKVATLRVLAEGRAPLEALARNMMGYSGEHAFPGIGLISVVGRAVLS